MHLGGTILGTTNRGHFVAKVAAGERAMIPKDIIDKAKETFDKLGLSGAYRDRRRWIAFDGASAQ